MTALDAHVADYLRLRRALGFKLIRPGQVLPQFVAYLQAAGAETITVDLAVAWARLSKGAQSITLAHRMTAVRGFARYMHTIDPDTQIPPADVLPAHQQRPDPYIYTHQQIAGLIAAAHRLPSRVQAAEAMETLLGLLASSGLRVGEALALTRDDVDLADGTLTIQQGKPGRQRLVPLHPTTTAALADYAARRGRQHPNPPSTVFFLNRAGSALTYQQAHSAFVALTTTLGLRTTNCRPRMHDLRHALAVHTLVEWQRDGVDIAAKLPVLSNFLGHTTIAGTWWYLTAVPELMQSVAARLEPPAAAPFGNGGGQR